MLTHQSIPRDPRQFRVGIGSVLSALGVLVAIAVTIIMLALTGANHTTGANPAGPPSAASVYTPQARYRGPHQLQAAAQTQRGASDSTAAVGNVTSHYTCLGAAQQCRR